MEKNQAGNASMQLSKADQKTIEDSVASIRRVLRANNRDIKSLVGVVSSGDIADTKRAVEVRFAEEGVLNVVMNMVAFD